LDLSEKIFFNFGYSSTRIANDGHVLLTRSRL